MSDHNCNSWMIRNGVMQCDECGKPFNESEAFEKKVAPTPAPGAVDPSGMNWCRLAIEDMEAAMHAHSSARQRDFGLKIYSVLAIQYPALISAVRAALSSPSPAHCEDCASHPSGDLCPSHFAQARKVSEPAPSGTSPEATDLARADGYYHGFAHGRQAAADLIREIRRHLEIAHNWIGGRMRDDGSGECLRHVEKFLADVESRKDVRPAPEAPQAQAAPASYLELAGAKETQMEANRRMSAEVDAMVLPTTAAEGAAPSPDLDALAEKIRGHFDMKNVDDSVYNALETILSWTRPLPPRTQATDLEAIELLEEIQWRGSLDGNCPSCGALRFAGNGHTEKCKLAKLIGRLRTPRSPAPSISDSKKSNNCPQGEPSSPSPAGGRDTNNHGEKT